MIFKLECWHRYDADEKDFTIEEVEAETFKQAEELIRATDRYIFKVINKTP